MRIIQTEAEPREVVLESYSTEHVLVVPLKSRIIDIHGNTIPAETSDQMAGFAFDHYHGVNLDRSNARYKVHHLSHAVCHYPEGTAPYSRSSVMMRALHSAFAQHIPFSLSPNSVWYCIAHELAIHIDQNRDRYRGYFTVSDEKDTLSVRDDSLIYGGNPEQWRNTIPLIREPIRQKVPRATIDLFMPQFTTTTEESHLSLLILFLNVLSNYYEINWTTLCGIPEVRIEGNAADWKKIVDHAELASHEFDGLKAYFADLIPVLKEIAGVAAGDEPNPEFWCSIYKYKSRSGGDGINGWITTLLAHQRLRNGQFELRSNFDWRSFAESDDYHTASLDQTGLPSHISTVPFDWHYRGNTLNMLFVTGFMGIEYDGFLNPKLGYGVLEKQALAD